MFFCAFAPALGGSEGVIWEGMRMSSVSRTLAVSQEHELLRKLEAAGLQSAEAQFVIDSRGNMMARRIRTLIRTAMADRETAKPEASSAYGYNFTERIRKILALARKEARRLRHEYVGTEHQLLGLILEGEGVGATVLEKLNVDLAELKKVTEEMVKKGKSQGEPNTDLPYTSRAKKVLELAMSEARALQHQYVGSEHLLLGLLREQNGVAAQALTSFTGINHDSVCKEIVRILGD